MNRRAWFASLFVAPFAAVRKPKQKPLGELLIRLQVDTSAFEVEMNRLRDELKIHSIKYAA